MRKDILIYFAGKTIPALVNLAIIVLAVRYLGEEGYGKYSLVFYACMLVSTLTIGWIQQSIIRFLSLYHDDQKQAINRFYFLALISTVAGIVIILFLALLYFHLSWHETMIILVYLFLYNIFLVHLTLYQARFKPVSYAFLEGGYSLLFLLVLLVFILVFHQKLFVVLFIAMGMSLFIMEGIRIFFLPGGKQGIEIRKFHIDRVFTKKVFNFGFIITIWLFLAYIMNIADRFIIKEFSTYSEVGTYAALKDLIIKLSTFSTLPILLAYHPKIVENWNLHRRKEALRLVRESLVYILVIFIMVFTGVAIFRNILFEHILHIQGEHLLSITVYLLISAFIWQAAMMVHKPLELLFRQRLMLMAVTISLLVNIAGNIFFIWLYGYLAAAVVAMVTSVVYILLVLFLSLILLKRNQAGLPDSV